MTVDWSLAAGPIWLVGITVGATLALIWRGLTRHL
jgi:hypothetical protein